MKASTKGTGLPSFFLRNTMSGELELFETIDPGTVMMYNCGPTVYDPVHIGNLRSYVLADTLRRALEHWSYTVKQVINITDVGHLTGDNLGDADQGEDRMEASAKKQGRSAQDIAKEITQLFFDDLDLLGIDRSKIAFPRATQYIPEQISLIRNLEKKGCTYSISDGVYFDTSRFPEYGKLGKIDVSKLKEGARVEENREKRHPADFALWKFPKGGEERQQEWESPWGRGFPGWHLECTAMIFELLGQQIDIHTGGIDHIATHHNGEIAQAEAVTGKRFVRYWLHNEFITIEGKRIGKSLGNSIYLHNIVDKGLSPLSLRYLYLTGHYRSPMNFTWSAVEGANVALSRIQRFYFENRAHTREGVPDPGFIGDINTAMANDLDTPKAIARIWELMKDDRVSMEDRLASLSVADRLFSLGLSAHQAEKPADIPPEVEVLMKEREKAREKKDFKSSDELREEIARLGYIVVDTSEGSRLERM